MLTGKPPYYQLDQNGWFRDWHAGKLTFKPSELLATVAMQTSSDVVDLLEKLLRRNTKRDGFFASERCASVRIPKHLPQPQPPGGKLQTSPQNISILKRLGSMMRKPPQSQPHTVANPQHIVASSSSPDVGDSAIRPDAANVLADIMAIRLANEKQKSVEELEQRFAKKMKRVNMVRLSRTYNSSDDEETTFV